MKTNIILFAERVAARAGSAGRNRAFSLSLHGEGTTPKAAREPLLAIWRVNPQTGRVECQWVSEKDTTRDSIESSCRQAAA